VPTADFEAKRALYPAPKVLHDWADVPLPGTYLEAEKLNSAELEFWGGDLRSAATKVGYIRSLGADVLYLNPIHLAYTNHKYDAFDYREISPEYGTHADFRALADGVHAAGMKLVMDGVFNHMGRNAPRFKEALRIRRASGATAIPSCAAGCARARTVGGSIPRSSSARRSCAP